MPVNILIKDGKKYGGLFVAKKTFQDQEVISSGDNPVSVLEEAKKRGIEDPVVMFVPKEGMVNVY